MSRKVLPLVLMLTAGAITSIICFIRNYSLTRMLWYLLAALLIFYIIGVSFKRLLDKFEIQNEKRAEEEAKAEAERLRQEALAGSVVEKEAE